jgi:ankyrin repeat protein
MLIKKGANVDAQDKEGRPPLHHVINSKQKGGTNCIKILLESGADVNLVSIESSLSIV